jgi:hypothetical protein
VSSRDTTDLLLIARYMQRAGAGLAFARRAWGLAPGANQAFQFQPCPAKPPCPRSRPSRPDEPSRSRPKPTSCHHVQWGNSISGMHLPALKNPAKPPKMPPPRPPARLSGARERSEYKHKRPDDEGVAPVNEGAVRCAISPCGGRATVHRLRHSTRLRSNQRHHVVR